MLDLTGKWKSKSRWDWMVNGPDTDGIFCITGAKPQEYYCAMLPIWKLRPTWPRTTRSATTRWKAWFRH